MKKLMVLAAAVFLVAATGGMAMAYTYADTVSTMNPTPMGAPNHAPNTNMNWLIDPTGGTPPDPDPNPNPDRLLGAHDQYAVGWGPGGGSSPWTGTANAIVHMAQPFTHDGVEATNYNPDYMVTDEATLSGMGYDLVIYGLGFGFDTGFESSGQVRVWVADELSGNLDDWTLVSSWSGDPNGYDYLDPDNDGYWENQDGTMKDGYTFNNGGKGALSYTYMTIDLDKPKIIDPATGELMALDPIEGVFNYVWFEGGYYEDDGLTHGNANFLDAFGANPVPIPGAVWLLGSGLLGLIGIRRKKS